MTDAGKKWRPAPNTRRDIAELLVAMQRHWNGLDLSTTTLLEHRYHDAVSYSEVRNQIRLFEDGLERLKFLLSIQQGLEHREFVDVICSEILALGEVLTSMEFLAKIEKNDPSREIQRKAGET